MQSEGLPTCRQALCVLGWSCEQAQDIITACSYTTTHILTLFHPVWALQLQYCFAPDVSFIPL